MAERFVCNICEMTEEKCDCEKYCCICQGANQVRLCNDGQWYCLECREACDVRAESA